MGRSVDTSAVLAGRDAAGVLEEAALLFAADGTYRVVTGGPQSLQLVRTFRPLWASVTGWITTVACLGAGFLFLLVKRTEMCTITVHDAPTGVLVTVRGRIAASSTHLLDTLLGGQAPAGLPPPAAASPAAWAPTRAAAAEGDAGGATMVRNEAVSPSGPAAAGADSEFVPVMGSSSAPADAEPPKGSPVGPAVEERTVARRPVAPGRAVTAVARFDDGSTIQLEELNLIGRDPEAGEWDGRAVLVPIVDPTMTVSKTHLALRSVSGGIEVTDRASTNGTYVLGHDGTERAVAAPVTVPLGCRVRFGDRWLDLVDATP